MIDGPGLEPRLAFDALQGASEPSPRDRVSEPTAGHDRAEGRHAETAEIDPVAGDLSEAAADRPRIAASATDSAAAAEPTDTDSVSAEAEQLAGSVAASDDRTGPVPPPPAGDAIAPTGTDDGAPSASEDPFQEDLASQSEAAATPAASPATSTAPEASTASVSDGASEPPAANATEATPDNPLATNQQSSAEIERAGNDNRSETEANRTLGQVIDIFA